MFVYGWIDEAIGVYSVVKGTVNNFKYNLFSCLYMDGHMKLKECTLWLKAQFTILDTTCFHVCIWMNT